MTDKKKLFLISGSMIFLAVITGIVSTVVVNFFAAESMPYGVLLGELNLSELTLKDASHRMEIYYPDYIKKRSVVLDVDGEFFIIPMEDIGVRLNKQESINRIIGSSEKERIYFRIRGIFQRTEKRIAPFFECDENMLVSKVTEIKEKADRLPANAIAELKNEKIEKKPEIYGRQINVEKTVRTIKNELTHGNSGPITLKSGTDSDFSLIKPSVSMNDIENIDDVLAKSITPIYSSDYINSIKMAAKAVNNIYVPGMERETDVPEFSFFKCLENENITKYNPGTRQVAVAVYDAIIKTNIPPEDIDGKDYTQENRKIKVTGTTDDFKFKNKTAYPMLIVTQANNTNLVVYVLGKKIQTE